MNKSDSEYNPLGFIVNYLLVAVIKLDRLLYSFNTGIKYPIDVGLSVENPVQALEVVQLAAR